MRRRPSRLRLPERERRLRAALPRGGADLRRAAPRDARPVRRQGPGAGPGRALRRPRASRHRRPDQPRQARAFLASLGERGAIMVKAVAGGGGRGMRPVRQPGELEAAYTRCQSEARQAFGRGDVYVERLLPRARHLEVQIVGDAAGEVSHLWERECSLQRQRQKLIEMAPAPGLPPGLRARLLEAALRLAREARYENVGTIEFLVDADAAGDDEAAFAFIEANARLQVEHTVTEEVTGIDLVRLQLELAAGRSLRDLGLLQPDVPAPRGIAMQVRINMETMGGDGAARPAGRDAGDVRDAVGSGRSPRHLRLRRLSPEPALRLAPGQAGGPLGLRRPGRRGGQGLPRAVRVQDRRRADQHRLPPESAHAPGRAGGAHHDELRRGARRGAGRGGSRGAPAALLRARRPPRAWSEPGWMRAIPWPCSFTESKGPARRSTVRRRSIPIPSGSCRSGPTTPCPSRPPCRAPS